MYPRLVVFDFESRSHLIVKLVVDIKKGERFIRHHLWPWVIPLKIAIKYVYYPSHT